MNTVIPPSSSILAISLVSLGTQPPRSRNQLFLVHLRVMTTVRVGSCCTSGSEASWLFSVDEDLALTCVALKHGGCCGCFSRKKQKRDSGFKP